MVRVLKSPGPLDLSRGVAAAPKSIGPKATINTKAGRVAAGDRRNRFPAPKYRELMRQARDPETTRRLRAAVAELEQKQREIDQ
jgi:hypothetical protein